MRSLMARHNLQICSDLGGRPPSTWVDCNPEPSRIWKTRECPLNNVLWSKAVWLLQIVCPINALSKKNNNDGATETIWSWQQQIIASPAPCIFPLPWLLCAGFTLCQDTYRCQIGFFIIIQVFPLKVPRAMAPSPPTPLGFHLIIQ